MDSWLEELVQDAAGSNSERLRQHHSISTIRKVLTKAAEGCKASEKRLLASPLQLPSSHASNGKAYSIELKLHEARSWTAPEATRIYELLVSPGSKGSRWLRRII